MPKISTFPILYNEVLQLCITNIVKAGCLKSGDSYSGVSTWKRNSNKIGSISWVTNYITNSPFIDLKYSYNGEPVEYRVNLVSIPSNIGRGEIWYFVCPVTKKRCRKLYSIGGRFLHREAFKGCMYESQTYSHSNRNKLHLLSKFFGSDKVYEQIYKKNFKRTYAGKNTKRYEKYLKIIEVSDSMFNPETERLLLM